MAVLGWGSTGPDVANLQTLLRTAGYYFGPVDGIFGYLTYRAVREFQAAKGLTVDGLAGPMTMAALQGGTTPTGPSEPSTPGGTTSGQALSLHIGINRVDPSQYGGWDGALAGCENDARTMERIARAEGFTTKVLMSQQATTMNILAEIDSAARALRPGGFFLLTYAGHGGQVADPTGAEETDQMDETWVAYNRQLLDDELERAFAAFPAGASIVVTSDSCHSGTVHRFVAARSADLHEDEEWRIQEEYFELKRSFYQDLSLPRSRGDAELFASYPRPMALARGDVDVELVGVRAEAMVDQTSPRFAPAPLVDVDGTAEGAAYATRNIPLGVNVTANMIQHDALARAKDLSRSRAAVTARGLLCSGCMDNQLSQEVNGAGVFTTTLARLWADNAFSGSYTDLVGQIVGQMGANQTPQLSLFGNDATTLAQRTPFNPT